MATEKDSGSSNLPIAGIAALLLVALGIGLPGVLLESTRPTLSHVPREIAPPFQQVPARLWEDPFEAVSGAVQSRSDSTAGQTNERRAGPAGTVRAHSAIDVALIRDRIDESIQQQKCVSIMPVMVSGGPYAEYSEVRRRTRYAVVSGLLRSGFSAYDEDHIGYVRFDLHQDAAGAVVAGRSLPGGTAFEWYERAGIGDHQSVSSSRRTSCRAGESVLILWLDEDVFESTPIRKLAVLTTRFISDGSEVGIDRVRLIGPANSKIFDRMRDELRRGPQPGTYRIWSMFEWAKPVPLEIYVWGATVSASEPTLPAGSTVNHCQSGLDPAESDLIDEFAMHGIALMRAVVDDKCVIARLVPELEHRGINLKKHHFALIAENETSYGQHLVRILGEQSRSGKRRKETAEQAPADESDGNGFTERSVEGNGFGVNAMGTHAERVVVFNYLRGLDGETARSAAREAQRPERAKDDKKRPEDQVTASGVPQLDYVRRAATQIRDRHDTLRTAAKPTAVIGVLGTDFYDKSMLLQALRREMPQALFFTTDIDARMTDANQRPWARNLLVASGLGLRLREELQQGIPPFRDSYQTSVFLSMLIALNTRLSTVDIYPRPEAASQESAGSKFEAASMIDSVSRNELDTQGMSPRAAAKVLKTRLQARAFEVGRREIFDYGRLEERPSLWSRLFPEAYAASSLPCTLEMVLVCDVFEPQPSPYVQLTGTRIVWALFVAVFAITLLFGTSWFARGIVTRARDLATSAPLPARMAACVLAAFVLCAFYLIWFAPVAEPFRWEEGFSAWPTLILRMLATVLAAAFCCSLVLDHKHMRRVLRGFGVPRASLVPQAQRSSSIFRWQKRNVHDKRVDAARIIREYLGLAALGPRLRRVAPLVVLYVLLGFSLLLLWDPPNAPIRGQATLLFHKVLLFTYIVFYSLLLFATVDAVRLFDALVSKLVSGSADYPECMRVRWKRVLGLRDDQAWNPYVAEWLNVQLIARQTESTVRLVYLPFVVLAIALVARSQIFDNWYTPPSLVLVFALGAAYTVFAIVRLRRTAECARAIAIDRMRSQLVTFHGDAALKANELKQLEMLLEDVRDMRKGAFMPLAQQPLWKAVLLPLSGFGGLEALQYVWLMNN